MHMDYRTDLALEAREMRPSRGVREQGYEEGGVKVTRIIIEDERGAAAIGKPVGTYTTIESDALSMRDPEAGDAIVKLLAAEMGTLTPFLKPGGAVLVVGLGNWNMTADALGPKTVERVLVSRHIIESFPETLDERVRPVCVLSPGVLGITGLRTYEVVAGVVERVKPACVVCVDALAAMRFSRILSTVQLCDTGIQPGSGVGGRTQALNRETLGVPVIALGVPMVVYASTIMRDTVTGMAELLRDASGAGGQVRGMLDSFGESGVDSLVQALSAGMENVVVTTKQIDEAVDNCASLVAMGINRALHPALEDEEIRGLVF